MSESRLLLIETATRHAVVGLADAGGTLVAADEWHSGHRHGEELLQRLDSLMSASGTPRGGLAAVAVGTGPGSFTGLRIGMATAKTIAYALRIPIVGAPTMELLAAAAAGAGGPPTFAIVLPAGVGDRYVARYAVAGADGARELLPPTLVPASAVGGCVEAGDAVVAVDLPDGEASPEAVDLGRRALSGLASALAGRAAAALAAAEWVDVAGLVPGYVALPRGVPASTEEMAWSPDLR